MFQVRIRMPGNRRNENCIEFCTNINDFKAFLNIDNF